MIFLKLKKEALNMIKERLEHLNKRIENYEKIKSLLPNTQGTADNLKKEVEFLKSLLEE